MDEDEKLFMKFVEDSHRLSTGTELESWQKSILLQWYRFHKLYPNAKIVMGRKRPLVVIPKEENDMLCTQRCCLKNHDVGVIECNEEYCSNRTKF